MSNLITEIYILIHRYWSEDRFASSSCLKTVKPTHGDMLLVQLNKSSSFCGGSESFYHVLSFHMQLPEIHLGDLRIFSLSQF